MNKKDRPIQHILMILPILALVLASCGEQTAAVEEQPDQTALGGKMLMEKNCFSCHNTQGTDNMLAPPMQRVKDHYWSEDISKEEFVSAIADWCENPTEEHSQMPGARRKFGLMPKQQFDRKEVEAIAAYLFEHDVDASACSSCGSKCDHEH